MRAGRSRACRMKSVDRGREMPLELLPARSQYLYATAGNAPAVCSFSFHPCLFLGLLVISHASSGQIWVIFWWFGGMCLSGWVVCVLDTIHPALPLAPSTRCLAPSVGGSPSSPDTSLCSCFGWGFWFSRTPAQCRLRGDCGAQSLGQCRGSGLTWLIDSPAIQ